MISCSTYAILIRIMKICGYSMCFNVSALKILVNELQQCSGYSMWETPQEIPEIYGT